jgi:hypothetical protein
MAQVISCDAELAKEADRYGDRCLEISGRDIWAAKRDCA